MSRLSDSMIAPISEIFSSIQGEGPRTGERHIFIRFGTCHLECAYCDERLKKSRPLSLHEVLRRVVQLEKKYGPHACVSLTGGEPLLHADFLKRLTAELRKRKFRILLETNGILWRSLSKVFRSCDIISMDLKLPSVTKQKDFLGEHRKFLEIARKKKIYIKIVISKDVKVQEYEKHLRMVARVDPQTPVFLQPMSGHKIRFPDPELMKMLGKLQRIGAKWLPDVRIGIQLHKIMNVR